MAKVLFISTNYSGYQSLPYTPALFTALLKESGHEVFLFDTSFYPELIKTSYHAQRAREGALRSFDDSAVQSLHKTEEKTAKEEIEHAIIKFGPDVVMISLTEAMYDQVASLLEYISPYRILTVLGGVFPTFAPEFCLSHDGVDVVCRGEGEAAIVELCDRLDRGLNYNDIDSFWVKAKDGTIIRNPCAGLTDINALPIPDYSQFEEIRFYRPMGGKLWKTLPFETNRGCPYQCSFCGSPAQSRLYRDNGGGFFRKKRIEKIYEELTSLIKNYSPDFIQFFSDTFLLFSDDEFSAFIEMYSDIKLPFHINTHVETVSENRIKGLRDVGLYRMQIGVEHGNENFRKAVLKKTTTNKEIRKAIEIIHSVDIPTGLTVNNMVGLPTETRDLAMETISFNHEIAKFVNGSNTAVFTPYHGTELRELAVNLGYMERTVIASSSAFDETLLRMPMFPKEDIMGIVKTFSLYMRFDQSRWGEIQQAEKNTPEGNALFDRLMDEYRQLYL